MNTLSTTPVLAENSLHNVENYKQDISCNSSSILHKYNLLAIDYLLFIIDNIHITNVLHSKFIILKGLNTITHVFNMILYYSKNPDLAFYHSQKSFYFYVEFISQITGYGQQPFLQLNSRDAVMFLYKKKVF